MGGKSSQSTQTVSIPPEVLARYNAVNARAEQAASTPFQKYSTDPNAFVAPLTATQQAGIAGTNAAAGMAQPYYGAATGYALAGGQAVNPGQLDVQQYMNPYLGAVVGNTAALLGQENQQAMSGQTGNAIQQGAFGGDRAGVAAANLSRQQNLAFGNTIGNLLQQGYGQALGTAQQQQGVYLGADQANRQALQQTAASLAGLGAGAQTAGLQGAQAQLAAGQVQQGTEQAGKTALYNQFLQEMSYPYQQAQFLANIAMGTGALTGSTTTGTSSISDRRAKHDVHEIGRTFDGQPIYNFKYNGDDRTQIGLMAQDVEKHHPEAVGLAGGMKTVDYDKATREAAHRGHFASGGLAGSSEGGMVHMGHMGEGYAGGGMIEPMGYGSSPFIGYDPTAAFQSLYGGLLGLGRGGMGGEGGIGGIGIPTGPTSHGELAVAKMDQPQMPDTVDQANKWADLGTNLYGLGKTIGKKPAAGQPKQGETFGDPVDVGRRVEDDWDYNPNGSHRSHFGGGYDPKTGAMSYAGGLIPGLHRAFGGGADSGDIDTEEQKKLEAAGAPAPETHDNTPITVTAPAPPKVTPGIVGEAPKVESLKTPDLNMPKPRTFLDGLGQVVDIGTKVAGAFMGAKDGGAIGYAEGGAPSHDESMFRMLMNMINENKQAEGDGEDDFSQHYLHHSHDIEEAAPEAGLGTKPSIPVAKQPAAPAQPSPDVEGLGSGLRGKIMHGEGTDKFSNPYDVVYGANPRSGLSPYANPEGKLSSMPIGAVQDFQRKLIEATRGKIKGVSPEMGTGAVGAYQFTRDTLADLARRIYGPDWKSVPFSPEVQDRLAAELARERHGHLAGTWAAFRDTGPEGAALRAQAGYAAGGLVGRHGYARGLAVEDQGMEPDESAGYVSPQVAEQFQPGARSPEGLASTQIGDDAEYMESANRSANPDAGEPTNLLPQQKERHRGFLGDILHGKFISGLGKGDADSWIPLIAGIGASMSGPYRGIVGLGQGLAAGAKTAQGMRQYGLEQQQLGLKKAELGLLPYSLQTERMRLLPQLYQYMLGPDGMFQNLGTAIHPEFHDRAGNYYPTEQVNAIVQAKARSLIGNNPNIDPEILKQLGMSLPTLSDMGFGDFGFPSGGLGGTPPQSPSPTGGGTAATGAPTPTAGDRRAAIDGPAPTQTAQTPQRPAVDTGPRWGNADNYSSQSAILPHPPVKSGMYTPATDLELQSEIAAREQGRPEGQRALETVKAILRGDIVPTFKGTNQPDPAWSKWAQDYKTNEIRVGVDTGDVQKYRDAHKNWTDVANATQQSLDALFSAGKGADLGRSGSMPAALSGALDTYFGPMGYRGDRYSAQATARTLINQANALMNAEGIPHTGIPTPGADTTAGAMFFPYLMQKSALDAYRLKNATFDKHSRTLIEKNQEFGRINDFQRDFGKHNPVTNFMRTELHEHGFFKGMSDQEKNQYAHYLPNWSKGAKDGLYQLGGKIIEVKDGKRYVGRAPNSMLNPAQ